MSAPDLEQIARDVAELKERVGKLEKGIDIRTSANDNGDVKRTDTLREWQSRGGRATAAVRTAEERSAAAKKAIDARWKRYRKERKVKHDALAPKEGHNA